MGEGATRARTSFTLSIYTTAWEVFFGHRGHTAFRDAPGTWRGDVQHPTDSSQAPGPPQGQQPQLCYSDQSSPAILITPLLAISINTP